MKKTLLMIITLCMLTAISSCRKDDRKVLKLQNLVYLELEEEAERPFFISVDIPFSNLPEMKEQKYSGQSELAVFTDYLRENLDVELDDRWKLFVHYYTAEKTVGMIEFIYTIGEISTDRSIIFNLDNGTADRLYYKHLKDTADERDLIKRTELFRQKYVQEKKELKGDEKLIGESVIYTYRYGTGKLMYSYNLFFAYGKEQVINNDYGTVCFIDENGNRKQ